MPQQLFEYALHFHLQLDFLLLLFPSISSFQEQLLLHLKKLRLVQAQRKKKLHDSISSLESSNAGFLSFSDLDAQKAHLTEKQEQLQAKRDALLQQKKEKEAKEKAEQEARRKALDASNQEWLQKCAERCQQYENIGLHRNYEAFQFWSQDSRFIDLVGEITSASQLKGQRDVLRHELFGLLSKNIETSLQDLQEKLSSTADVQKQLEETKTIHRRKREEITRLQKILLNEKGVSKEVVKAISGDIGTGMAPDFEDHEDLCLYREKTLDVFLQNLEQEIQWKIKLSFRPK